MIISQEAKEHAALEESPSNPYPEPAFLYFLIPGALIWRGLCTSQGEKEFSWSFGHGGKHWQIIWLTQECGGKVRRVCVCVFHKVHNKLWRCEAAAAAGQVRLGSNWGHYKSSEHETPPPREAERWISGQHLALSGLFILTENWSSG